MNFGETLALVFEAHIEDLASGSKVERNTRYTHNKLECALSVISWKWKKEVFYELSIFLGVIRRHILKCPHNEIYEPYNGRRQCNQCGGHQRLEVVGDGWDERKEWGEWEVSIPNIPTISRDST
jgi:hypothetical protein